MYLSVEQCINNFIILNSIYILYSYINWTIYFKRRFDRHDAKSPFHETKPNFMNKTDSQRKTKLVFDDNYLPFRYFLFASYFIIPNTWLLGIVGTVTVVFRTLLNKIRKALGIASTQR